MIGKNIGVELLATGEYLTRNNTENIAEGTAVSVATERNLLVRIEAIAANTVDAKDSHFLSWDASGKVLATGSQVKHHKVGDWVFFPGDMIIMSRSNVEHQLLDERLVGKVPVSKNNVLDIGSSVNNVSAWEILFNRCGISNIGLDRNKTLLLVGGEAHLGASLIELAKTQAELFVIATASRSHNKAWLKQLGVDCVVNHHNNLDSELALLGVAKIDYIVCLNNSDKYTYTRKDDI